jgi:hypothetical protein
VLTQRSLWTEKCIVNGSFIGHNAFPHTCKESQKEAVQ